MTNQLLVELDDEQLNALAFFKITDVATWDNEQITIKPLDQWTEIQKLAAKIEYGENGEAIGVECLYKLEALEMLAERLR
jgi:hypothetical protein